MSLPYRRNNSLLVPRRIARTVILTAALGVSLSLAAAENKEPEGVSGGSTEKEPESLHVCSDPNNLPFSNRDREGFENELAELVADALGRDKVEYYWHPQRRGFARRTLNDGRCDLIMGVPARYELARTTTPYYRSTYVFVTRDESNLDISHIADPLLQNLSIGVHVVGDDYSNTPGAEALGRRGLITNLVGYSIYGDYSTPHPPSRLIEAVAEGEVDTAIAWGPLAGYFIPRQEVPLKMAPVRPEVDQGVPFAFDIAMAVRRDDEALHTRLNQVIASRDEEIRELLTRYGVPLMGSVQTAQQVEE